MPVARRPVFTPMSPIRKRVRHGDYMAPTRPVNRLFHTRRDGACRRRQPVLHGPARLRHGFRLRDLTPVFKRLSNALRNGREGPSGENAGQRLLSVRRRRAGACRRAVRCRAPREGRAERAGAPICARTAFPVSDGRRAVVFAKGRINPRGNRIRRDVGCFNRLPFASTPDRPNIRHEAAFRKDRHPPVSPGPRRPPGPPRLSRLRDWVMKTSFVGAFTPTAAGRGLCRRRTSLRTIRLSRDCPHCPGRRTRARNRLRAYIPYARRHKSP